MLSIHSSCKFILYALDILQHLKNDIVKYSKLDSFLIIGGTNAWTVTGQDYIDNDDKHISVPSASRKFRFTRKRQSQVCRFVFVKRFLTFVLKQVWIA